MLATSKSLSLIEQKKLQWAKEREEMIGLCGLWGRPKNQELGIKNNLLPPIQRKPEFEESKEQYKQEEESETSGYLSDSPKHLKDGGQDYHNRNEDDGQLNNDPPREEIHQQYWSELEQSENYWADKKMYKNYKNENWAHQNTEPYIRNHPRVYPCNKNYWYGTPDSASSDDGSRLRWGDRGVGIGHLWEPVINHPDCRLPQVDNPYGQTPKWVEKGLKNADGNKADILIIHHPDDEGYDHQKNYLLGQNAPIPPEIIEERERKRKKALEHQNAIKKQLEERELKRKQDRENRIREERLEEERIKKEQEIERLRYEEEQRKIKEKEEIEKRKEEAMREAIEVAEKRAKEEKKRNKRHLKETNYKNYANEKPAEQSEVNLNNRRHPTNTPRYKRLEDKGPESGVWAKKEQNEKKLKDSSCQFEEIQLANNFQLLNMNGLPMDGGLALMLDNPPKDNFLLPPEGVQLALLMSPRNSTNRLISASPPTSASVITGERTLTPSKYRITERMRFNISNKSTQTDFKLPAAWSRFRGSSGRSRKSRRCGTNSGSSGGSQKGASIERQHKHVRCFIASKHRSKHLPAKISLEDRPKWGINRPSVQYKKQSEKDPYYQKKIKERLKKAAELENSPDLIIKNEERMDEVEEKELDSAVRLLDCQTDEDRPSKTKDILRNGYRMNSNLSSPVFVPIGAGLPTSWNVTSKIEFERSRSRESVSNEEINEEEDTAVPGSVGFLTQTQLEAIKQITSLREGLKRLQKDSSNSRSVTPFSDKSLEK